MAKSISGRKVDSLILLQNKIDLQKKEVKKVTDKIKKMEETLDLKKAEMLQELKSMKLEGATGKSGSCEIQRKVYPKLDNFVDFMNFVKKSKEYDLLIKKVNTTAFRLRLKEGKEIPGVSASRMISLNLKKKKSEV